MSAQSGEKGGWAFDNSYFRSLNFPITKVPLEFRSGLTNVFI